MKLKLLQHLSGADGVNEIGDEIEVTEEQAIAFIEKGIAEPKTKKELDTFLKKVKELKTKKAENDAKVKSILQKSEIQNKLNELYLEVVLKEAEFNGEVLTDEQVLDAVESLSKRDAMVNKKASGK